MSPLDTSSPLDTVSPTEPTDTLTPAAFPVEDATLDRLRDELFARAAAEEVADVGYTVLDSPVGPLLLAATTRGLVKVGYVVADFDSLLAELAHKISPRIVSAPSRLEEASRQLTEYFEGERTRFSIPLDQRLATGFRLEVQNSLHHIDYGTTASYGEVADLVGHPRAARAVGTACATNPLPIVIPCHRVIRSDGSLGRYGHCTDVKRVLLELEHAL